MSNTNFEREIDQFELEHSTDSDSGDDNEVNNCEVLPKSPAVKVEEPSSPRANVKVPRKSKVKNPMCILCHKREKYEKTAKCYECLIFIRTHPEYRTKVICEGCGENWPYEDIIQQEKYMNPKTKETLELCQCCFDKLEVNKLLVPACAKLRKNKRFPLHPPKNNTPPWEIKEEIKEEDKKQITNADPISGNDKRVKINLRNIEEWKQKSLRVMQQIERISKDLDLLGAYVNIVEGNVSNGKDLEVEVNLCGWIDLLSE